MSAKAVPVLERVEATTAQVRAQLLSGISTADLIVCLRVLEQLAGNLGTRGEPGDAGKTTGKL